MVEDDFGSTRVANALDHGGVVHVVGEDDAAREFGAKSGESGVIRDIARGENESGGLAVKGGEFLLECEVGCTVACDVTGASRTCTILVQGATAR